MTFLLGGMYALARYRVAYSIASATLAHNSERNGRLPPSTPTLAERRGRLYSTFRLATRIASPKVFQSFAMSLPKSLGVLVMGSAPIFLSASFVVGSFTALANVAWSLSMMGLGRRAGGRGTAHPAGT